MFTNVGEYLGFLGAISRAISSTRYAPPLASPQDSSKVIIESAFPAIVKIATQNQNGYTTSALALQASSQVGGSPPETSRAVGEEAGYQRPLPPPPLESRVPGEVGDSNPISSKNMNTNSGNVNNEKPSIISGLLGAMSSLSSGLSYLYLKFQEKTRKTSEASSVEKNSNIAKETTTPADLPPLDQRTKELGDLRGKFMGMGRFDVANNLPSDSSSSLGKGVFEEKPKKMVSFGGVNLDNGCKVSELVPLSSLQTAPQSRWETLIPTPSDLRMNRSLVYSNPQQDIEKITRQLKGLIKSEIENNQYQEEGAEKYLSGLAQVNPIRTKICEQIFKEKFSKEFKIPNNYEAEISPAIKSDSSDIDKAFNQLDKSYKQLLNLYSDHSGVKYGIEAFAVVPRSSLEETSEQRPSLPIPYSSNTNSGHGPGCLPPTRIFSMRDSLVLGDTWWTRVTKPGLASANHGAGKEITQRSEALNAVVPKSSLHNKTNNGDLSESVKTSAQKVRLDPQQNHR